MTDWNVRVETETGYVKDVQVKDYIYMDDAVNAALSQTGAKTFISAYNLPDSSDVSQNSSNQIRVERHSTSWGPRYTRKDKMQIYALYAFGVLAFLVVPPLAIVVGVLVLIKAIWVSIFRE